MKYSLTLLVFAFTLFGFSQEAVKDTLWYLDGDTELISNYELSEDGVTLFYLNHKGKRKDVDAFYIFSINKADGTKQIIYNPQKNAAKEAFSVEDMEAYMQGAYQAKKHCKAPFALIEGILVGAASPFIVATAGVNPMYSILIPALNSGLVGLTKPGERKIIRKFPEQAKSTYFVRGYKDAGRKIRTKKSIIGGVIGLAGGIVTYFIINK